MSPKNIRSYTQSLTNMTVYHERNKDNNRNVLHEEMQSNKDCSEWEKQSSSGKNTSFTYPIPNG